MKKLFILLFAFIFLGANAVFAYDAAFKKDFYDGFTSGFFYSMSESLRKNGVPAAKVDKYTVSLKGRLNRKDLENKTWACVEKHNYVELISKPDEWSKECFTGWKYEFMTKNSDLLKLLK